MHESLQSGSNKRAATSPLESNAKQGRLETVEHQNQGLELVPQAMDFHKNSVPTTNSLDRTLLTDIFSPDFSFPHYPMNESRDIGCSNMDSPWFSGEWSENVTSPIASYDGAANMNHGASMSSDLFPMNSFHADPWTRPFRLCLEDNKPADFLAIRKTQGSCPYQCQRLTWLTRSQIFRT